MMSINDYLKELEYGECVDDEHLPYITNVSSILINSYGHFGYNLDNGVIYFRKFR